MRCLVAQLMLAIAAGIISFAIANGVAKRTRVHMARAIAIALGIFTEGSGTVVSSCVSDLDD